MSTEIDISRYRQIDEGCIPTTTRRLARGGYRSVPVILHHGGQGLWSIGRTSLRRCVAVRSEKAIKDQRKRYLSAAKNPPVRSTPGTRYAILFSPCWNSPDYSQSTDFTFLNCWGLPWDALASVRIVALAPCQALEKLLRHGGQRTTCARPHDRGPGGPSIQRHIHRGDK